MIDKKAIHRYHNRVDKRLAARKVRFDGYRWEEDKHPRSKDGKFTSGSGSGGDLEKSNKSSANTVKETTKAADVMAANLHECNDSNGFAKGINDAKNSLSAAEGPWRVTSYKDGAEFDSEHPGAKMHMTDFGSTIATTSDGDIVGVCHKAGDPIRGKRLLQFAVEHGGKKLDAYQGLFGFYIKCGFEPVSWCKWDEQYAPEDWVKGRDKPEHIIFYKYTGEKSDYADAAEFFSKVPASKDYGAAQKARDDEVK